MSVRRVTHRGLAISWASDDGGGMRSPAVCTLLLLGACAGDDLVGQWQPAELGETLTLTSDQRYEIHDERGAWSRDGNALTLTCEQNCTARWVLGQYEIELAGSKLLMQQALLHGSRKVAEGSRWEASFNVRESSACSRVHSGFIELGPDGMGTGLLDVALCQPGGNGGSGTIHSEGPAAWSSTPDGLTFGGIRYHLVNGTLGTGLWIEGATLPVDAIDPDDPLIGTWNGENSEGMPVSRGYSFGADGTIAILDGGAAHDGMWKRIDPDTIRLCGRPCLYPYDSKVRIEAGRMIVDATIAVAGTWSWRGSGGCGQHGTTVGTSSSFELRAGGSVGGYQQFCNGNPGGPSTTFCTGTWADKPLGLTVSTNCTPPLQDFVRVGDGIAGVAYQRAP